MKLAVVIASTRPGRVGLPVGNWFYQHAQAHGKFEVALIDLAEINLPLFNEAAHPRLQQYEHEHTKDWSRRIDAVDALVFVTPEYNHSVPASLLNALDYLNKEWAYKPVGFVTYGGVSAGTRALQVAKQVVVGLRMMPIPESVNIPFVAQLIAPDGTFQAGKIQTDAADLMLDELYRWTEALQTLRQPVAAAV